MRTARHEDRIHATYRALTGNSRVPSQISRERLYLDTRANVKFKLSGTVDSYSQPPRQSTSNQSID